VWNIESNSYDAMYYKRFKTRLIMGFILSLIFLGVIIWFGYKIIKRLLQNGSLCELFCKENKRID
jgi:TRAP-type C4-dicarboxylate transport system permease small subunit